MKDLVSVIVPVYNTESYLERCYDSIRLQDSSLWELIIVDDGSTDNSVMLTREYIKKYSLDKQMRIIQADHGGAGAARNIGISAANGEYICFVDSDDFVTSTYISKMLNQAVH